MEDLTMPESGLDQNPDAAEQAESVLNIETPEPDFPSEIDPAALAELERNMEAAGFKKGEGTTASGSEGASGPNLDDFELDPKLSHLYHRGRFEPTEDGGHWVCAEHQFMIVTGTYSGQAGSRNKAGFYTRLDDMITAITNGAEGIMTIKEHGWRLSAIIPNGTGLGVAVFERNVRRVLPDPKPIEKVAVVADVKDEELVRVNEAAQAWADEQRSEGEPSE